MKWKSLFMLSVVLILSASFVCFSGFADEIEVIEPTSEVSEVQPEFVQDEQPEPAEQLRSENLEVPELVQAEQIDPFDVTDPDYWKNDIDLENKETAPLSYSDVTLADINFTLNSIFFCIVICMACALVSLVIKIVYPLFRGGR